MKAGDLVEPKVTCGGPAGDTRCKTALIIAVPPPWPQDSDHPPWTKDGDFEVLCKCGISWQSPDHVKVIDK